MSLIRYVVATGELDVVQAQEFGRIIEDNFSNEYGDKVMPLADRLIEHGIQQGRQEGRQEGVRLGRQTEKLEIARKMLARGADIAFVSGVTGLTIEQVSELQEEGLPVEL